MIHVPEPERVEPARQIADGAVVAVVVEVGAHPYCGVLQSIAIVECQRRSVAARLMGTDVDGTREVGPVAIEPWYGYWWRRG